MTVDRISLTDFLAALGTPAARHEPWPRFELSVEGWTGLRDRLAAVPAWSLLGLWGETGMVHLALRDDTDGDIAVASLTCPQQSFPSLSGVRPAAKRLERAIQDLTGLAADGLDDPRPWLDHDRWRLRHPLAAVPGAPLGEPAPYPFLPSDGEGLHQIPVGPVHAGIIEPGHFRFTCQGETVVRLEERLGYVHKGVERLMKGRLPEEAARLAGRLSGDSSVAHTLAFCLAVEAALGVTAPRRAQLVRAVMAELERIANHVNDIGAIANDGGFAFLLAECAVLREQVMRTNERCFGHRFLMDRVVPGGIAVDLKQEGRQALADLLPVFAKRFRKLVSIYDAKSSLLDRTVGTGVVSSDLAHRFGAGGYVGRASSRGLDARRMPGYAPYDELDFQVPVLPEGDVNARVWIRIREVEQSLDLIAQILKRLESGPGRAFLPESHAVSEGMALVEGFRGEILAWVRISDGGRIERAHSRDPSWFQWPLLEAAIEGNIVADFPLCNKSFNCSYSGHDL
ncbi:nickel-dependent hydrogenase large subunit [Oleisolibacter albus]|uniref:hydrogenase large subunit n=1 Tax=Oleisolibacter albus TaxID=2171757 RepID=UPI000DF3D7B7|nr:nickel-dependent hydrogenase large subunit [Oleisolibacter albus]